jgi:Spy/CpxP family protein refolding chaperone
MKKSGMIKTLCACTMLLVLMVSQAQTEEKACDKKDRLWAELELTEEQKVKLKELHQEIKDARRKNFEAARDIRTKIKDELIKENPSTSQLDLYAAELGEIHKQIAKQHNDHLLKVKTVLSSEQFSKIVNMETEGFGKYRMKAEPGKNHKAPHKKCPMENKEKCKKNDSIE